MSAALPAVLAAGALAVLGMPTAAAARARALGLLRPVPAGRPEPRGAGPPSAGAPDPAPWPSRLVRGHPVRAGLLLVAGLGLLLGPGPGLLAAGAGVAAPSLWGRVARRRAQRAERVSAGAACVALAAELRAGRLPAEALTVAAGVASGVTAAGLARAGGAAAWGGDVPSALLSATRGSACPDVLRGLAACWQVCTASGSGLAGAFGELAAGIRARQAQERAVATALAGPRSSALVLAALPLAGVALGAGLGAAPGHVLLHTPVGLGCLVLGLVLDAGGLWWTAHLADRAQRVGA